jgi:hypothetical protein
MRANHHCGDKNLPAQFSGESGNAVKSPEIARRKIFTNNAQHIPFLNTMH